MYGLSVEHHVMSVQGVAVTSFGCYGWQTVYYPIKEILGIIIIHSVSRSIILKLCNIIVCFYYRHGTIMAAHNMIN